MGDHLPGLLLVPPASWMQRNYSASWTCLPCCSTSCPFPVPKYTDEYLIIYYSKITNLCTGKQLSWSLCCPAPIYWEGRSALSVGCAECKLMRVASVPCLCAREQCWGVQLRETSQAPDASNWCWYSEEAGVLEFAVSMSSLFPLQDSVLKCMCAERWSSNAQFFLF